MEQLIEKLCRYETELTWLEFKTDNYNPETIGEDISALANGAVLEGKDCAYFLWGVDDKTHTIVGTSYNLQNLRKGNEELENWLHGHLSENADFEYHAVSVQSVTVGLLVIHCAKEYPVSFRQTAYVRVGSYTKKLTDYPSVQARLWQCLQKTPFEKQCAKKDLLPEDVFRLLDTGVYFESLSIPIPSSFDAAIHFLEEDEIVFRQDNGLYGVSNAGAILFAKNLSDFSSVSRKKIRIVQYDGINRLQMLREEETEGGYASGFPACMKYISALVPFREIITDVYRKAVSAYPILAIREILANALIHQDFSVSGASPTVEIFDDRMEITNPGTPLIDINRIVDNPPKSRNEKIASMMRRMKMCEELGTGWDKIVISCEAYRIPAPKIELYKEHTKVVLSAGVPFQKLPMYDKVWSCYLHACVLYVQGQYLTNASYRTRFALPETSAGSASRIIKETVNQKLIKPRDPFTSNKYMSYIPYWA